MANPGPVVFQIIPLSAHPLWATILRRAYGEASSRWLDGTPASLAALANEEPESRATLRLITGHFWLSALPPLWNDTRFATCLREPVERMLAHYLFVKNKPRHPLHATLHQRRMGPMEYVKSGLALDLDNGQVRALLDARDANTPFGALNQSHLEKAWARLQSMAAFGLAERFEESVALVQIALGSPDLCYIKDTYDWVYPVSEAFGSEEKAVVRESQLWDTELHRRATGLLHQRLERIQDLGGAIERQRERGRALELTTRWQVEPKALAALEQPARDVVWIASYPRSGNSWMRFLLDAYVFGPATDMRDVSRLAVELDYWHTEARVQNASDHKMLLAVRDAQKYFDRRGQLPGLTFFKTHYQWSDQHPLASRTRAAIILVRDPRDVLISGLNFGELQRRKDIASPALYAEQFISKGGDPHWIECGYGTWEGFALSWLSHGRFPVFLLRYEDLKANTEARLTQTLEFLGVTPDPDRVRVAVEHCRIDRLRDLERARRVTPAATKADGKERWFFNRGLSGQSLRSLDESEGDDLDARFEAAFGQAMSRWGYEKSPAIEQPAMAGERRS